jgi:hypothetical protein
VSKAQFSTQSWFVILFWTIWHWLVFMSGSK